MAKQVLKNDSGFLYRLYERRLQRELEGAQLPKHVAVILDGNRRWAKRQNGQVSHGHRAGAAKISEFLGWCDELCVEVVTLYLLSEDNLSGRQPSELGELFEIIAGLTDELSHGKNWQIRHVGATDRLPAELTAALEGAIDRTATATGLIVNLAVGYGGRREISHAVRRILLDYDQQKLSLGQLADDLTPEMISQHLYTGGQPDPELILRTSGEQRLSDFLLWQSAHSEFYFAEVLWPDFRRVDFLRALRDYSLRHRRYGG